MGIFIMHEFQSNNQWCVQSLLLIYVGMLLELAITLFVGPNQVINIVWLAYWFWLAAGGHLLLLMETEFILAEAEEQTSSSAE